MEKQNIANGGVQYVPQIAVQYVYLDFDGELTSYNGEILTVENVEVKDSSLTKERIAHIVAELNAKYASQNVIFVTDRPVSAEYSTIFIGKTSAFDKYGNFAGLAETIDEGNKNSTDKAFVMLDSTADNAQILSTISHETDHLLGTLDHGGEGLNAYAAHTIIYAGTTSTGLVISSGNSITVSSGGVANSTTVNSGGYMFISSGGTANSIVLNHGGGMYISSGGTATAIKENGGYVNVFKGANVTFVSNTISGLTLNTSMTVHKNTVANSTTVNSGGVMNIWSGGVANNTTVNSGGSMRIYSGGTATNIIWTPCVGHVNAYDDAYVTYASSYSGVYFGSNNQLLSHTQSMTGKVVHGYMYIMSGGVANNTTVNSGGWMYIYSGGVANSTTVNSGGYMYISSGGVANNTTVNSWVFMHISSGGTANSTTVKSGGYMHITGGTANSMTVNSGGYMYISGGTATSITALDGAKLHVIVASDTYIQGTYNGSAFEMKDAQISGFTVNSGGVMNIWSGGVANNTTVKSSGFMHISSGGVANSTTVNSGGVMNIWSGGVANNTTVKSGGDMIISSGSVHRGSLQIQSGAVVSVNEGGVIDFTLTSRSVDDDWLINDFSGISGTPSYTVTVAADQEWGEYKLAQGAENFNGSISVGDGVVNFGSLAVNGESLEYNGSDFALFRNNGDLILSISESLIDDSWVSVVTELKWQAKNGVDRYFVELSKDNFETVLPISVSHNQLDALASSSGNWQWRVRTARGTTWLNGEKITELRDFSTPQRLQSNADGNTDLFFAEADGTWEVGYAAEHQGIINGWLGTEEQVKLTGKNKIADVFKGSRDANVLVLTDDSNGDALFVDDIYTSFGKDAARIAQIDEIRAGVGDDIIDLTSQKFAYVGEGVKVYGGVGNDTIWANQGKNILFGDAGNDRIVGGSGDDVIIGGIGNDSMHGGGGEDIFSFGGNWGNDTITQLADGKVTLWFEDGSESKWNASTLTYTDGENSVKVTGIASNKISLKFGGDTSDLPDGAFAEAASEKIFEDKNKGMLA